MAAQTTACPSCMFGAVSSTTLSFTAHAIETITVSIIPHVTVWTNGTEKTSYERITETKTDWVGSGSNTSIPETFTNKADITWTYGDATLTYPTSYLQFLGFEGASAATDNGETCAKFSHATLVELPATTDAASFIYPLTAKTESMALPTPLLDYLAQLPAVSEQFNGMLLRNCAPLTWIPPASVSASATAVATSDSVAAPVPQTTMPSSVTGSQEASSQHGTYASPSHLGNYSRSLTSASTS